MDKMYVFAKRRKENDMGHDNDVIWRLMYAISDAFRAHQKTLTVPYDKYVDIFNINKFDIFLKAKKDIDMTDDLFTRSFYIDDCKVRYNPSTISFQAKSIGAGKAVFSQTNPWGDIDITVVPSPLLKGIVRKGAITPFDEKGFLTEWTPSDYFLMRPNYEERDDEKTQYMGIASSVPWFYMSNINTLSFERVTDKILTSEHDVKKIIPYTSQVCWDVSFKTRYPATAGALSPMEIKRLEASAKNFGNGGKAVSLKIREVWDKEYKENYGGDAPRIFNSLRPRIEGVQTFVDSSEQMIIDTVCGMLKIPPEQNYSEKMKAIENFFEKEEKTTQYVSLAFPHLYQETILACRQEENKEPTPLLDNGGFKIKLPFGVTKDILRRIAYKISEEIVFSQYPDFVLPIL